MSTFKKAFFPRFPGWQDLAEAPVEVLEEFLKPLGLWKRRAASLRALAAYAAEHNGMFPNRYEELLQVPAVGQYVAHAILMFQHGERFPLIDVNMARVVERFTRIAPDTLDYEFTVDDPGTFTRPWSGSLPYALAEGPMFEFACHEGNYGMRNMLAGSRAEERAALEGR